MASISVIITCYNRLQKTIACLDALFQSHLPEGSSLEVFLVDDGSKDGTGESIRQRFPDVHLIIGNGSLYWNGGMRAAFAVAMRHGFDYYLWLNDDTVLYENALRGLLDTADAAMRDRGSPAIIVGTTQEQRGGTATYGGLIRMFRHRPLKFSLVIPSNSPLSCDTMNGNCVLIPSSIAEVLGNLDEQFVHTMGDVDYGLRARKAKIPILVMPGYAGTCMTNDTGNTGANNRLSCSERWRRIMSAKELPPKAWYVLTKRHAGLLWPIFWSWPYLKTFFRCFRYS